MTSMMITASSAAKKDNYTAVISVSGLFTKLALRRRDSAKFGAANTVTKSICVPIVINPTRVSTQKKNKAKKHSKPLQRTSLNINREMKIVVTLSK